MSPRRRSTPRSNASLTTPTRPPSDLLTDQPRQARADCQVPARIRNPRRHPGRGNRADRQVHAAGARAGSFGTPRRARRHASARNPDQTRAAGLARPGHARPGNGVGGKASNCAKRLECAELAPAFERPPPHDSASKLDALQTLRAAVRPQQPQHSGKSFDYCCIERTRVARCAGRKTPHRKMTFSALFCGRSICIYICSCHETSPYCSNPPANRSHSAQGTRQALRHAPGPHRALLQPAMARGR